MKPPQNIDENVVNNLVQSEDRKGSEKLSETMEEISMLVFKSRPVSECKNILNLNADPSKGLYILASFQNKTVSVPIKVLIDSGSSMSLLDKSVFNNIPENMRPVMKETEKQIKFADGSVQKSEGVVTISLRSDEKIVHVDFLLGKYTDEAILGMHDIHALGLKIDFQKMTITQEDRWMI
jgi:predicted aspartyl protease